METFSRCWSFVGEFTGYRWILPTKGPVMQSLDISFEQAVEQASEFPVIWDIMTLTWLLSNDKIYMRLYHYQQS